MGAKRKNVDMSSTTDEVKVVASAQPSLTETSEGVETPQTEVAEVVEPKKTRGQRGRSKRYQAVRSQVDKTRAYDPFSAIEMVKKLSYSKFDGTIVAHAVLKDVGHQVALTFPHSTGQSIRVAIATDELIAEVEAGQINFDILVSSPQFMPKLAKLARVLGPKGLMPNPKTGTLTENPERKKQELEAGSLTIKTEKKAPLMHVTVGTTKMDTKQLVENLQTLIKSLKEKLLKVTIAASMSPGVKVSWSTE